MGEQERNGEMQTLEEEEGETENKLVSPPPTSLPLSASLSGLLCARLLIDSDVLIYVLMIGLVCSLCSAMLRLNRKQDHRGTQAYIGAHTHIPSKMKGLTHRSNACRSTHMDVCFSGTTEMRLYFAKETWFIIIMYLIRIESVGILQYIILKYNITEGKVHARHTNDLSVHLYAKGRLR